jgi:hypothetical protein
MLERVLHSLEHSDPRFYAGIKKWLPLLDGTVRKVCAITGQDSRDVLQDLLEGLAKVNALYDVPLYRFKGSLYEKVCEDRGLICLKTVRHHKSSCWFWTNKSQVEVVKKSKLEFLIGLQINQKCYDMISSHCTRRHGYRKVKSNRKIFNSWGHQVQDVYDIQQDAHAVNFEDYLQSDPASPLFVYGVTPEMAMVQKQRLELLSAQVSPQLFGVLRLKVEDPGIGIKDISELLDLNSRQLWSCKKELKSRVGLLRRKYDAGLF